MPKLRRNPLSNPLTKPIALAFAYEYRRRLAGRVRAKLQAGESEEQIIGYFVERYGDSILIEPPRHGFGLAVWIAPVGALAIGALLVWSMLRSWRRREHSLPLVPIDARAAPYRNGTATSADEQHVSTLDRARAELDRYRREG